MKLLVLMILVSFSAFSDSSDILLRCTETSFDDIKEIVVSKSLVDGEILVTEISGHGALNTYSRSQNQFLTEKRIVLSEWYGYRREMFSTDTSWKIEYFDECSSGSFTMVCR